MFLNSCCLLIDVDKICIYWTDLILVGAICLQNIGSVTPPPIWWEMQAVGKIRKLILDFLISCLGDIVRGWGSGRGQGERLVNLGHNQPTQPSIYWNLSEVLDREVILAKTN